MKAISPATPRTGLAPVDWARQPGLAARVLEDVEAKLRGRRQRRKRAGMAAAGAVVCAFALLWLLPWATETGRLSTLGAQRQSVVLADGSTVEMNARSAMGTDFRYGRRTVTLTHGEAFFSVAKDAAHPFLVETPGGVVRVTGTSFNVRLLEGGLPEVTLIEGAVNLRASAGEIALAPGQQYQPLPAGVRQLSPQALVDAVAWRSGRLVLEGLTLGEAVARMAAYHGRDVEVAPSIASLKMGGSCSIDDFAGFMDFLPRALSVSVLPAADGSYRIVSAR